MAGPKPAKKKLEFSAGFPLNFLSAELWFVVPWLVSVLVFELVLASSFAPYISNAFRCAYFVLGYLHFKKVTPLWLSTNGEKTGDRAILRATTSSLVFIGGLLAWYASEDFMN